MPTLQEAPLLDAIATFHQIKQDVACCERKVANIQTPEHQHQLEVEDASADSETPAYAVVSSNLTQARELAASGAYGRPSDAWAIYKVYLQGDLMIRALSANPEIDLNPVILGQMGDRVFHFLLRTSPDRFSSSKLEVIKKLLQLGVDPLEPDRFGNTALHIAAELPVYQESAQLMDLLLGEEAPSMPRESCLLNIDRRNGLYDTAEMGDTALHVAILHNNETCAKILLESGASTHLIGLSNRTPLSLAVTGNCIGIVHLLLEHGAVAAPRTMDRRLSCNCHLQTAPRRF